MFATPGQPWADTIDCSYRKEHIAKDVLGLKSYLEAGTIVSVVEEKVRVWPSWMKGEELHLPSGRQAGITFPLGGSWDGSDPGPAPLSGQVLSWPVDDDPEENTAPNKKEGQDLKKNGAKVRCWERTMTKLYLSCKNSDGRTRTLLLGQFGVSESQTHFCGGKAAAVDTHLDQDVMGARGWVWVASL